MSARILQGAQKRAKIAAETEKRRNLTGQSQEGGRREAKKTSEEDILQPKHTPETVSAAMPPPCKHKSRETAYKTSQLQQNRPALPGIIMVKFRE